MLTGDHKPLEQSLLRFRDPVDAAGGTCYINPPRMRSQSRDLARLSAAVVATVGELFFDGSGLASMSQRDREIVREMLHLRREHRALTGRGPRIPVACDRPSLYTFLRGAGADRVLVALNFSDEPVDARCDIPTPSASSGSSPVPVFVAPHDFAVVPLPDSAH